MSIQDPRLAKLCSLCQTVVDKLDAEPDKQTFPFHGSIETWKTSAHDCALCMRLLTNSSEKAFRQASDVWAKSPETSMRLIKRSRYPTTANNTDDPDKRFYVELLGVWVLMAEITVLPQAEIQIPNIPTSTGADLSLNFAKTWLQNCIQLHQTVSQQSPTLSIRLIEIGHTGIRLSEKFTTQAIPQYVTLSHCWGKIDMFTLKKERLSSFFHDIPCERLCKTFSDTINVVKRLGFSYLWIDCLCIIQDDENDWRLQSALMSQVYGNAVVNIAASHARSGDEGLFIERNPLIATRHFVNTSKGAIYELFDAGAYERCLSKSRLSTRAWAFQERFLAQRTLHFTAEQIFCECRVETVCEVYPHNNISELSQRTWENPFVGERSTSIANWTRVVLFYSRSKLTYSKDKLVAISGVARYFRERNGDQYVAGLWRKELERQLCWRVITKISPDTGTNTMAYRAPSWSWACHDEAVNWWSGSIDVMCTNSEGLVSLIQISKIDLEPAGDDDLGQLRSAKLHISSGPLMHNIGPAIAEEFGERDFKIVSHSSVHINGQQIYFDNPGTRSVPDRDIYFLPVLADNHSYRRYQNSFIVTLYGLVVTTSVATGNGSFKRIGAFFREFEAEHYAEIMLCLSSNPKTLADEGVYEKILEPDKNGIKRYAITLI